MCLSQKVYYARCFVDPREGERHFFWEHLRCRNAERAGPGQCCHPLRDAPPRWSPAELLPPVLVLALGILLLLPGHGLWFDELFTAEVGRRPLGEILAAIRDGEGVTSYLAGVPPSYNAPYYVVVHAWTSVPGLGSDTALRVLSLLATAGGLALATRAVARLGGTATGVLAGLLMAASPLLLQQSVEARSYGLVVLATGAAALGLVRWLQEPPRGLLLLGVAGVGTLLELGEVDLGGGADTAGAQRRGGEGAHVGAGAQLVAGADGARASWWA